MSQKSLYWQTVQTLFLLTVFGAPAWAQTAQTPFPSGPCQEAWVTHRAEIETSPLESALWKKPLADRPKVRKITFQIAAPSKIQLTYESTIRQRLAAVPNLGVVYANPGHAPIRSRLGLDELDEKITRNGYLKEKDPAKRPAINIVTDEAGYPIAYDAVGGHHRFFAVALQLMRKFKITAEQAFSMPLTSILEAGYLTDLEIAINGVRADGSKISRRLPAHGLDFNQAGKWTTVAADHRENIPSLNSGYDLSAIANADLQELVMQERIVLRADKGDRTGELLLNPALTNYETGSRATLETAFGAVMKEYQPKIAVLEMGTLAKTPSQQDLVRWSQLEIDEVVILWKGQWRMDIQRYIEETNALLTQQRARYRLNLYMEDYASYIKLFGPSSFLSRIQQLYETYYTVEQLSPIQ